MRECTPELVSQVCGISRGDLLQAARLFAGVASQDASDLIAISAGGSSATGRKPTLSLYCQGLNQSSSGAAKNAALINLHLATGQIGKPGAGPFSLTGQPNAMGGREVGGMANLLSGHRDLNNAAPVSYTHLDVYKRQYLERTVHFVARVGLDYVKKRIVQDAAGRKALWEQLQFALDGEPDPWFDFDKAAVDTRQFAAVNA